MKMENIIAWCGGIYYLCYAFEAPIRYGLHLVNLDLLIYGRDVIVALALTALFARDCLKGSVHPAFWIFFFVISLHGLITILNLGSFTVAVYGAKVFLPMLAGAVAPPRSFRPTRAGINFFIALWTITAIGVILDKCFFNFPWIGMEQTIGEYHVEVARDWQVTGADKRAGGFLRSSIHVALFEPIIAFTLIYNSSKRWWQILVALITGFVLFMTTQKGAMIAYALGMGLIVVGGKRPVGILKLGVCFTLALAILLPVIAPEFDMPPSGGGVFSMQSFNDRVQQMWPEGWAVIDRYQVFPFGIGLGGIGGGMRLYAPDQVNSADNLFVFMYGCFGVMALVYLGWILLTVLALRRDCSITSVQALLFLIYYFGYGAVVSILEDQLAGVFLGQALAWIGYEVWYLQKRVNRMKPAATPSSTDEPLLISNIAVPD